MLRAGLPRYAVLLTEGSVWSGLAARCLVLVDNRIPHEHKDEERRNKYGCRNGIRLGRRNDEIIHDRFNSWTFIAKAGTRHWEYKLQSVILL
ncbi:hypothetical protein QC760_004458 [Botrytis cinerea]